MNTRDRAILESGACAVCSIGCVIVWHDHTCPRLVPFDAQVVRDAAADGFTSDDRRTYLKRVRS